jgi:hypothetical protein
MIGTEETEGKLLSEELDTTGAIEILSGEELERKQAKAEAYAAQPERVTPLSFDFEMQSTHGSRLITYDDDKWGCSCDFFQVHKTCSHVMAVGRILQAISIVQPRGNVADT